MAVRRAAGFHLKQAFFFQGSVWLRGHQASLNNVAQPQNQLLSALQRGDHGDPRVFAANGGGGGDQGQGQ